MSAPGPSAAAPSVAARIGLLIAIELVFVLLAPLIGAFIWVALVRWTNLPGDLDAGERDWLSLLGLIYTISMSYYVGAAPAAVAGLVIGVAQAFVSRAGWPLALGTGLVVAVAVLERSGQLISGGAPEQGPFPEDHAVMVLACLTPILTCWTLVRGWHFAQPRAKEGKP